ncbi:MAG: PD-(D/E)XK nuclease family protein [Candidatus Omnitrophica bacterium]|nr:PD-(D/E)XK nuclease family protein [Candidatus Omnitrophota bacterium]
MRKSHYPNLTLSIGPAGSGKTHACLDNLNEALHNTQNPLAGDLLFILPTAEHRERVVDLLLRRSAKGFFGRVITTFDEALHSFLKLGGIRFASDVTRHLVLKDLIQSRKFEYFEEASNTNGFVDLVAHWIAELKESLVTAEDFEKLIPRLEKAFPFAKTKYRELFDLYHAYDQELARLQLKDKQDALFLLEEGLKRGEWQAPHFRHIWIDGFFDFSELQFAFIRFLAAHSDAITATLTLDKTSERRPALFQMIEETKKRLTDIGFKPMFSNPVNQRAQNEALSHLEKNLFTDQPTQSTEIKDAIQIFEATGLSGELEMIAREIKRIFAEKELNYSDIALIFRNVGPYLSVLKSVFSKFKIPLEIHEREELRAHLLARTIVSFLSIFLNGWKREDVFNFLKSSFVHVNYKTVCEMELAVLREGFSSGRENWLRYFKLQELEELRRYEDSFGSVNTVSEHVRITREALRTFQMDQLSFELTDQNRRDHAVLRRVESLLDEMVRKYSGATINFQIFAQVLIRLIEVDLFSFHTRDKNKVQIYNVSLARQKEYRIVFLPALLEKQFPVQVKEDPIFSDEERREANQSKEILKERLPRQAIERFFFYLGVTRAREQLILSYPRFDLEGKEALPSFYVDEVKTLFRAPIPTQKQTVRDVLTPVISVATPKEAMAQTIHHLWQAPETKRSPSEERLAISFYNTFLKDSLFRRAISELMTPIEGKILDQKIKERFLPKDDVYTPTRLEEYAECPYRYFAHQLLHLESVDEKIDPRLIGSILHDVLERFHKWAKERGIQNVTLNAARAKCEEYLDDAFHKYPLLGDRRYRIELSKQKIGKMIDQILTQEIGRKKLPLPNLQPEYFEYAFGFEGNDSLEVETEEGIIKLRGKIDRIDVDPTRQFALVIDYKTGKKFESKALKNGTALQLPIYLLAIEKLLHLKPLGAHLYQLLSATSTGFHHDDHLKEAAIQTQKKNRFSSSEWDALFEQIIFFLKRFVGGIRNAEIPVKPRDCVRFCSYAGLCRVEKWRLDYMYREIEEEDKKWMKEKVKA